MPARTHQRSYWQKFKRPYAERKKLRGSEAEKGALDTASSIAGEFLPSKGKAKYSRLPEFKIRWAKDTQLERRAVRPDDPRFAGMEKPPSVLERIFLRELERRGLREGRDFDMQQILLDGKRNWAEFRPDFMLYFPRVCAVEVQGMAFHMGITDRAKDQTKEFLERVLGIPETLYIWETTLEHDELTQRWFRTELGL